MEPEPLRHYIIDKHGPPQGSPHQHDYHYTSGGEFALRHCKCGKSWVLVEMRNLIDNKTFFRWEEVREMDEV